MFQFLWTSISITNLSSLHSFVNCLVLITRYSKCLQKRQCDESEIEDEVDEIVRDLHVQGKLKRMKLNTVTQSE